ncbi:hypothetical protein H8356DRAFT_1331888 [Neocallimastix lanati (nom. inval.)]|nr:hypothetical protein H8356DRAFT_1331888 [Neocallimastix sp. JGI-2020a]
MTFWPLKKNNKSKKLYYIYIKHEDQTNKVRNGKLPYNFNKETNFNEYCQYCHKNGHNTDNCFFNPSNSLNNNYRGENKNKNNKSITSRNLTAEILKEENNGKEDSNEELRIIDSGTGINLSKNLKILSNIEEVTNRGITYSIGQSDRIFKKDVFYVPNIQNNLISTHYLMSYVKKALI